jgi:hypothetical protein
MIRRGAGVRDAAARRRYTAVMDQRRTNPDRASRAVIVGALSAAAFWACLASAGCSDPLLSPKDERSPFDRYDAVRNQHAPQFIEDKFGRRQPNLAGRLAPKN